MLIFCCALDLSVIRARCWIRAISAKWRLQSAVYPSFSGSVVLHWCRRHVTVESSARHIASVDLERSGSDDKTWTTMRRTCGHEGCNIRNPDADDVQIGLEVYRQHNAATTSDR